MESLAELAREQETATSGAALDKRREEKELEDAAHALGRALVIYLRDKGDETTAAQVDLPISGWRRMRDEQLLAKARLAESLAKAAATGPEAALAAEMA